MFTVNVYMNTLPQGGHTRFYHNHTTDEIGSFPPIAGTAVIFRQPPGAYYLHDGCVSPLSHTPKQAQPSSATFPKGCR
jgi:hypothetical protein